MNAHRLSICIDCGVVACTVSGHRSELYWACPICEEPFIDKTRADGHCAKLLARHDPLTVAELAPKKLKKGKEYPHPSAVFGEQFIGDSN